KTCIIAESHYDRPYPVDTENKLNLKEMKPLSKTCIMRIHVGPRNFLKMKPLRLFTRKFIKKFHKMKPLRLFTRKVIKKLQIMTDPIHKTCYNAESLVTKRNKYI
ncbi:hypothetical protein L9F63_028344, partial [Diploptera punctata]